MPVTRIQASMSYSPASLYAGLPLDLVPQVETVLDNRLASSSWRKVQAAVKIWRAVADVRGWPHIIATDDPDRGGKLVTFVLHMLTDTDLVWGSVQTYVWGVRTWVQSAQGAVSSSAAVAVLFARVSKGACFPRGFDLRAWVGLCCPHLG
jgi:hypothetical protein